MQFISFDETPIYYRRIKAENQLKAIVIIIHGLGEHGGRYQAFAEYLSGLGIESFLPDLRGFGKSGGRRACIRNFSEFHRDLGVLQSFIARNHKEISLFLIGHSFGGLVASSYLAFCRPPKVQGLVLSSPLFGIAAPVPWWRHSIGLSVSYIFPDYSQPTNINPSLLTHDKTLRKQYVEDDLIFQRVSARLYRELMTMTRKKNQIAKNLALPVLLLQAGKDFVVSKEEAVRFYDRLKTSDKELEIYPDFFHEILNETHRDLVYSRLGLWILKHNSQK